MARPHVFPYRVNVQQDVEATLPRVGIVKIDPLGRKVTSHSFWRAYATPAGKSIVHDPFLLGVALGHTWLATTDPYRHPAAPTFALPIQFEIDGGNVGGACKIVVVQGAA